VARQPYPNPSYERAYIDISTREAKPASIALFTNDGRIEKQTVINLSEGVNTIAVQASKPGVYHVRIQANGEQHTLKLMSAGARGQNRIEVISRGRSESKGQNAGIFTTTDILRFVGYATYNREQIISEAIEESVTEEMRIVFTLPIAYGEENEGLLSGRFSVSDDMQVQFSQGNLQYSTQQTHPTADGATAQGRWRFAAEQYLYIGEANSNIDEGYGGVIDLFGWGTSGWNSGAPANQPYSTSSTNEDYTPCGTASTGLYGNGSYADWGMYNAIQNGGNRPMQWRTLTAEEWQYLFDESKASRAGRSSQATITNEGEEYTGILLLPDSFELPTCCEFTAGYANGYSTNIYTLGQWEEMEGAGAVFLATSGRRNGTTVSHTGARGIYWSSSPLDEAEAKCLFSVEYSVQTTASDARRIGLAVRLVREAEGE